MLSNLALSTFLLTSVTSALPSGGFYSVPLDPRDGPACPAYEGDQPNIAKVHYASDANCNNVQMVGCIYMYQGVINAGPGNYGCGNPQYPDGNPIYARVEETNYPNIQLAYTRDQSCPPSGPAAVFAVLKSNRACVQLSVPASSGPGLSSFPNGGSGLPRLTAVEGVDLFSENDVYYPGAQTIVNHKPEDLTLAKRATQCSGFRIQSQTPTYTRSIPVSVIVDCINGNDSGCSITAGQSKTETISTSYSLSAGGGIEGIFSVEATFGQEFSSSVTASIDQGFTIPKGQKGYLSVYSAATLFNGVYTGCNSGPSEQAGQVVAVKKNTLTYQIILTGKKL